MENRKNRIQNITFVYIKGTYRSLHVTKQVHLRSAVDY